jgi:tRNA1Val (adenine37-N6)-methyltransferase
MHHHATMRVNTDGVLVGAWAPLHQASSALDIGTGCGVIALMLAQRGIARVEAIDIDPASVEQTKENIARSPWATQITTQLTPLQELSKTHEASYDLLVSNPPYFHNAKKCDSTTRNLARHNDTLSFEALATCSHKLLTPNGHLALILPTIEAKQFEQAARIQGLFIHHITQVIARHGKAPSRQLMLLGNQHQTTTFNTLTIRNTHNEYTSEYRALTADFYLAF